MRLSEVQKQRVHDHTGATMVPDDNPSMPLLKQNFGDHTFFLDNEGLHVWEAVEDDPSDTAKLVGVRIASWSNDENNALVPHEPAPSHVIEPPAAQN